MLSIGYLIILYDWNMKKLVSEISIFEPPKVESGISRWLVQLLPQPLAPVQTPKQGEKLVKRV